MFPSDKKLMELVNSILKWFPCNNMEPAGLTGRFSLKYERYFVAEPTLWQELWELIPPRERYISGDCTAFGDKWRPIEIAPKTYVLLGGGKYTAEFIQKELDDSNRSITSSAAALGKLGGDKMAKRGPEYFKRISAMRKNRRGGRPKKTDGATSI